jgi:hypothetical protein
MIKIEPGQPIEHDIGSTCSRLNMINQHGSD